MPKVSINTCTFNRAHLIGETIKSVLNQSFQDFEYIIVDDGSTDNTEALVNSFNDHRIHFFTHPRTNGQLSKLRNFGHSKSAGEYIAYIDSDDIWEPEKLEIQILALENDKQVDFSYTNAVIFAENKILKNKIYDRRGSFKGNIFPQLLKNETVIYHTTLLIRRKVLDILGPIDESFHLGDHDFVMHMSKHFNASVTDKSLAKIRKHDQNYTRSLSFSLLIYINHHRTLQKLFDAQLITKSEFRQAIAKTSYDFAKQLNSSKDYRSIKQYLLKSIKTEPWRLKASILLVLVSLKSKFSVFTMW
jgi:glycosyltransferase involved in cell wall biosynthesis